MKHGHRAAQLLSVGALAAMAAGCLPSLTDLDNGPLVDTFAVTDYYTPSGYMGDGQRLGLLSATVNEGCKTPRPPGARGNCYRFTYLPNQIGLDPWAGAFWVFPANNWGSEYGHAVDSTKFKQIRFYAAIEGPSPFTVGGQAQFFNGLAGGIDPAGFYDNLGLMDHKDAINTSVAATIGTEVTTELKQFRIPLTDFIKMGNCVAAPHPENCANGFASDVIAAFGWALHYPTDSAQCASAVMPCPSDQLIDPKPVTIYIDDIVWDTEAPPP